MMESETKSAGAVIGGEYSTLAANSFKQNAVLIFCGQLLSMIGDQFTLIALPWLVYSAAHNPAELGWIIGTMGIARAVFLIAGGKLVDQFSAKAVSLISRAVSAVLMFALAFVVNSWPGWTVGIYGLAALVGAASAFTIVSAASILPACFHRERLAQVNAIGQAIRVASGIVGPLAAAAVIHATTGTPGQGSSFAHSAVVSFFVDAMTFVLSFLLLLGVRTLPQPADANAAIAGGVFGSPEIKALFVYFLLISVVAAGSMQIIVPTLVAQRLGGDADLFGIVMAVYGVGALIGMAFAARLNSVIRNHCGRLMLAMDILTGLGFLVLIGAHALPAVLGLSLVLGLAAGMVQVSTFTWIQSHVDRTMIGRTMALFLFVFVGVVPISAPLFGYVKTLVSLDFFLAIIGVLVMLVSIAACFNKNIRNLKY
jgi:MFS family permease